VYPGCVVEHCTFVDDFTAANEYIIKAVTSSNLRLTHLEFTINNSSTVGCIFVDSDASVNCTNMIMEHIYITITDATASSGDADIYIGDNTNIAPGPITMRDIHITSAIGTRWGIILNKAQNVKLDSCHLVGSHVGFNGVKHITGGSGYDNITLTGCSVVGEGSGTGHGYEMDASQWFCMSACTAQGFGGASGETLTDEGTTVLGVANSCCFDAAAAIDVGSDFLIQGTNNQNP